MHCAEPEGIDCNQRVWVLGAPVLMCAPGPVGSRPRRRLYIPVTRLAYNSGMDVAITDLRAHLSEWLERAREGAEVVVTDRGVPVARLLGLSTTATLERLAAEGVIGRPASARRPVAAGRARPRPRRELSSVVSDQRR